MNKSKRGILVVSFGTSHNDTCAKTIDAVEQEMRSAYPEYPVYRAWTSGKIRRKIEKRDGVHIYSVAEAIEAMQKDGLQEIIVQPTHVLNGIENEQMKAEIQSVQQKDSSIEGSEAGTEVQIVVGAPLLSTQEDCERIIDMLIEEWEIKEDEMLVLMGHGTEHHSDFVYAALNYHFLERGCPNRRIGTVEGCPAIEDLVEAARTIQPKKIILTPFMIVAGDHANNDMAGDKEDSWKCIFEKEGYEVTCVLKGLGEYKIVRQMLLEHLKAAMESLQA